VLKLNNPRMCGTKTI